MIEKWCDFFKEYILIHKHFNIVFVCVQPIVYTQQIKGHRYKSSRMIKTIALRARANSSGPLEKKLLRSNQELEYWNSEIDLIYFIAVIVQGVVLLLLLLLLLFVLFGRRGGVDFGCGSFLFTQFIYHETDWNYISLGSLVQKTRGFLFSKGSKELSSSILVL